MTRRTSSRGVIAADRAAETVISVGGVGVLAAMLGICVFLVAAALPLLLPGSAQSIDSTGVYRGGVLAHRMLDIPNHAVLVGEDGVVRFVDLGSGTILASLDAVEKESGSRVTAAATDPGQTSFLIGFEDGSIRRASIRAEPFRGDRSQLPDSLPLTGELTLLDRADLRSDVRSALRLSDTLGEQSVVRTDDDDDGVMVWNITASLGPVYRNNRLDAAIANISISSSNERRQFSAISLADGRGILALSTVRRSLGGDTTGEERWRIWPIETADEGVPPPQPGDVWYTDRDGAWIARFSPDGDYAKYDSASPASGIALVDAGRALEAGRRLTAVALSLGGESVLVGDDAGNLRALVNVEGEDASTFAVAHEYAGEGAVTSIATGTRDRTVAVLRGEGELSVRNVSSGKLVTRLPDAPSRGTALISPSNTSLAVIGTDESALWTVESGHAEATLSSLFGRVHYEGYDEPVFVYQSSGGIQTEPKFNLVPLIFGTMKATIFSMIFAVPLGVFAAIYTTEFVSFRARNVIKPVIELMASLPSVVLGFLGAMLIAPLLEGRLPMFLASLVAVPFLIALVANMWGLAPRYLRQRATRGSGILVWIGVTGVAGIGLAALVGPMLDTLLFASDSTSALRGSAFRVWLDGTGDNLASGWIVALLPFGVVAAFLVIGFTTRLWWADFLSTKSESAAAIFRSVRYLLICAAGVGLTLAVASLLGAAGVDPRESIFGPFSQRNTLVVGIVMGFAVIPIIYTISQDALESVPGTLRSASLAVGATPWQTAINVIVPVAASGIFSGCMIGLGRAVGETMIVLMATGNTPEMTWNIFSGFRTLAANIAVEMPEAPKGGTHYRVLFLCGLALFAMTLVINTSAEVVRQRFRKRNAAL